MKVRSLREEEDKDEKEKRIMNSARYIEAQLIKHKKPFIIIKAVGSAIEAL